MRIKRVLRSVFLSLNQDFPERTQTCFEYRRLWVWLCRSVVLLIFKTPVHNSCRGMKLQGKQKYFFFSYPQTTCTKQSLSADGPRCTRICGSASIMVPSHLNPTCSELQSTQECPRLCFSTECMYMLCVCVCVSVFVRMCMSVCVWVCTVCVSVCAWVHVA